MNDKLQELETIYKLINEETRHNSVPDLIDGFKQLQRDKKIMQAYFQLIMDVGHDYDGANDLDHLKRLIDELCRLALSGRDCDDGEAIYANGNKKYNILHEEIKEATQECK